MTILRVPEGSCEDSQQGSVLYSSNCCRNVFKNLSLVAYWRCTNISDILVEPSSQKLTTRLLPRLFWYHSRNCTTCPTLKKAEIDTLFISPVNLPSVKFHITCTTFNVIHTIQHRLCNLQYIGETKRRLKYRFNEHRRPVLNGSYIHTAVSDHFVSNNHSENYMLFISFEQLRTELDSSRKAREAHYIRKGKTLEPLGVNKRDDLYFNLCH